MPDMLDASNGPDAPAVIHRHDYAPPAFTIETVHLEFDLDPARTVVTNRMRVRRAPGTARSTPLELDGEQLELLSSMIDGRSCEATLSARGIVIRTEADVFELTIKSACKPAENTSLMGLYLSNGNLFTQCEAEGFRKITYFLDRPDVMATYTVTLRAQPQAFPVLLSNGNLVDSGQLEDGRHYAVWEDPFRKPSYLFALVAARLVALEETIITGSGESKLLQVWVEERDLDKTRYAMDSLIRAIRWDETRFGLELDLERFMIVAVGDFNMGAMENKGLNIFNTKYVLANPETATDADFANVEAVVGHEYFHNWTGNRVTCRDWFQLSLKEGLTVFRDQEFSADMAASALASGDEQSAHAVKRIEDVRLLRQMQFAEDAGPMAHPVRPESYAEINNFYTVTIYEKGAEVVRMYQTLFGREGFARGLDLYFERHDGQAVTCDDFRKAMADANGRDLTQFERWYSQAGTPRVAVETAYDADTRRYRLTLRQGYSQNLMSDTPREPLLIPFALGLVGANGQDIPLRLEGEVAGADATGDAAQGATTRVLELTEAEQTFIFTDIDAGAVPSLLRNFSAPVSVEYDYSEAQLSFLLAHDSDAFNRWEAGQRLATRALLENAAKSARGEVLTLEPALVEGFAAVLRDTTLASAYRDLVLSLPSESYLAEQMAVADPAAVHRAREFVRTELARALRAEWISAYEAGASRGPYQPDPDDAGRRALRNMALSMLALADADLAAQLARAQYDAADNMTDRFGALATLVFLGGDGARAALDEFYRRFEHDPLVVDKWFALQAMQTGGGAGAGHEGKPTLAIVESLMQHPAFTLRNPNRARSLIFSFCAGNPSQFHAADGSGYRFWAQQVIALDALNPQVAARLARQLERWNKFTPGLRDAMQDALRQVARAAKSRDVQEVVEKALQR